MTPNTSDPAQIRELAHQILTKNVKLKKGESIVIEAWSNSLPYAEAMQLEARKLGAKPLVLYESEPGYWDAVASAPTQSIGEPGKAEWSALENADAYMYFWGPVNRDQVRALPDKKREALAAFNPKWYKTAAKHGVRGFRMEIALAEPMNAKYHGVDLDAWRRELLTASFVDPQEMHRIGTKVSKALEKGKRVRITHPNGTDLTLGLKHRKPVVADGEIDDTDKKRGQNVDSLPAGSVVVAVDEAVAEGRLVSNRPFRVLGQGYTAEGGEWEFKNGKLTSYRFEKGGDRFAKAYEAAPKGKEKPGLFEVGLNRLMKDAPTFEDQERGAVTLYLGGNTNWGGSNKVPFVTYLIVREPTVEVDGKVVASGGKIP
ncbi:MAG: aminopeptidase [Thermoplasmata archaeon]|nr:aminopeptidase [Thermoplasmata archaeon]